MEKDAKEFLAEISNPQHPDHQRWQKEQGNGPISERIKAAFSEKYKGTYTIGEDLVIESGAAISAPPPNPAGTASDNPQAEAVRGQVVESLQRDWGMAYQENSQFAGEALARLFPNEDQLAQTFEDARLHLNAELQTEAARLLAKLGRAMRTQGKR